MKWLRFRHAGQAAFGSLEGDHVVVHEGDMFAGSTATGERVALAGIEWLTPCAPRKIIGLWNNFNALAEKNGWARPADPLYFLKATSSCAAHGQAIVAPPAEIGRVAYEGELAIVIGKSTKAVTPQAAPEHIFGYTCANDVTAIELLNCDPSFAQWARAMPARQDHRPVEQLPRGGLEERLVAAGRAAVLPESAEQPGRA